MLTNSRGEVSNKQAKCNSVLPFLLLLSLRTQIELEENDVSVLNLVVTALLLQFTRSFNSSFISQLLVVLEFVHFRTNETLLKVRMNHSSSLRSKSTATNCPAFHLIRTSREEMNEVQYMVSSGDDSGHLRLGVVLLTVGFSLLLRHVQQLGLEASAEGNDQLVKTHCCHLLLDLVQPRDEMR